MFSPHKLTALFAFFAVSLPGPLIAADEFGFSGKVHETPQAALSAGKSRMKPILLAVYSKEHNDDAKVKWRLSGLVGMEAGKKFCSENFVQAVIDKKKVKELKQIQIHEPFEGVTVFFLTPSGALFQTEQITYNADTGYKRLMEISEASKKADTQKP